MKSEETIINGNRVYWNGYYWVVESADGSWDGFESYTDKEEAIEAAKEPNSTEEDEGDEEDEEASIDCTIHNLFRAARIN